MLKVVEDEGAREAGEELLLLDEIARMGARRMLIAALRTEADDYVARHREERDERGHALVVHNGQAQARKLTLGAGTVELRTPRVNDRRRERATRGAGSRTKGLLMAFKLLDMAQQRWRRLDGARLLPLVRAGVKFVNGVRQDPTEPITHSTNSQSREAA